MRGLKQAAKESLYWKLASHLLQMRGLKPIPKITSKGKATFVASFTDAWIETYISKKAMIGDKSHLLQMRGLKLILMVIN